MKKKIPYIITLVLFITLSTLLGVSIYAKYKQEQHKNTELSFEKSYLNICNPQEKQFVLDENQSFFIEISNTLYGNITSFDLIYNIKVVDKVNDVEYILLDKENEELKSLDTPNMNVYEDIILPNENIKLNDNHNITITLTSHSGYEQFIESSIDVKVLKNKNESINIKIIDNIDNYAVLLQITIPDLYRKKDVLFHITYPLSLKYKANDNKISLKNEIDIIYQRGGVYNIVFIKDNVNNLYTLEQFKLRW